MIDENVSKFRSDDKKDAEIASLRAQLEAANRGIARLRILAGLDKEA